MQYKFEGSISKLLPEDLILKEEDQSKLDGLFLTIALIFNDVKSLHLLSNIFLKNIEQPEQKDGISYHQVNI